LVNKPPIKIKSGNNHGNLKKRKTQPKAKQKMNLVILLLMANEYDEKEAKSKKPIAIAGINLKMFFVNKRGTSLIIKDNAPIKMHAGKIQINKVKRANEIPPLL
jgi:hypothetical protein